MGTHSAELYGKLRVSSRWDENANNILAVDIKHFRIILVYIFMPIKSTYYNFYLVLPLIWDDVLRKLVSLKYCNLTGQDWLKVFGNKN